MPDTVEKKMRRAQILGEAEGVKRALAAETRSQISASQFWDTLDRLAVEFSPVDQVGALLRKAGVKDCVSRDDDPREHSERSTVVQYTYTGQLGPAVVDRARQIDSGALVIVGPSRLTGYGSRLDKIARERIQGETPIDRQRTIEPIHRGRVHVRRARSTPTTSRRGGSHMMRARQASAMVEQFMRDGRKNRAISALVHLVAQDVSKLTHKQRRNRKRSIVHNVDILLA